MSSRGPAVSAPGGTPAGTAGGATPGTAGGRAAGAPATSPAGSATASPWVDLDRAAWSRLAAATPLPLDGADVERLRGLGERIDLAEVEQVYLPLSRLLNLHAAGVQRLHAVTSTFLDPAAVQPVVRAQGVVAGRAPHGAAASAPGVGAAAERTPFVIAVAGSVAVGKSTTARLLRELLSRWPETPRVELVTTDGFLLPNAELERRGLLERKGFPESYDQRALLRFVTAVKSGAGEVRAPLYSHLSYDIVPGAEIVVRRPDVLIVEGLNVLQPARTHADGVQGLAVSDFFDVSVYVDARTEDIRRWYVDRFLRLRETAFARPESYFRRYADLSDAQAAERAAAIWARTNEPNLLENVLPTRGRATIVLRKGADHAVTRVRLRKL